MPVTTLLGWLLAGGFALQPPGQFHAGEPVARDGESWLALQVDGRQAALLKATLHVRPVHDALVDEEGARTGLAVSSRHADRVIAYLRGGQLAPGVVETAALSAPVEGHAGLPYEFSFRGQPYRLSSQCERQPRTIQEQQAQFDCHVELRSGGRVQILMRLAGYREPQASTMSLGDDASPALLFAGDLDRDGRLDLIFDTSDRYNLSRPTLFLSSPAGPGELLHPVASYASVGC